MASMRVARVRGIPIEIHASWPVVFALIGTSLSVAYFPASDPGRTGLIYGFLGVTTALLVFASVLVHELSHSLVARGHNLRILRITLFIFGGVAQMRGEPPSPRAEFRIAVAGPVASLALAVVFRLLQVLGWAVALGPAWEAATEYLTWVNLLLGMVNLVPAYPLDGGRVLRALLWARSGNLLRATRGAARLGRGIAHLAIAGGLLLAMLGVWANGLWILFLGWFLLHTSRQSEAQVELDESLRGVTVEGIMEPRFVPVRREMSLDRFVEEYLVRYGQESFPVVQDEVPLGVVGLDEVQQFPREEWPRTTLQMARRPLEPTQVVTPGMAALEAVRRLAATRGPLLVMNEGRLVGMITVRGLQRLVAVRQAILSHR